MPPAIIICFYTANTQYYVSKWTYNSFTCCVAGQPLSNVLLRKREVGTFVINSILSHKSCSIRMDVQCALASKNSPCRSRFIFESNGKCLILRFYTMSKWVVSAFSYQIYIGLR